jgi:hypothetical protein
MKNEKFFLIIVLILFCIIALNGLKYISSLREQNKMLATSIDIMMKRIAVLESNNAMEKIVALKSENADLKRQIDNLKASLSQVSKKPLTTLGQETKKGEKGKGAVTGNRGFLIKNDSPTR